MSISTTIAKAKEQLPASGDSVFEAVPRPSETDMKLLQVPFSNKELNEAGKIVSGFFPSLVELGAVPDFPPNAGEALEKVEAWRLSHAYPLRAVTFILSRRARVNDQLAIISSRMKRMTSIAAKLKRQPTMQLTTMQDVGGCRAILGTIEMVNALANHFRNDLAGRLDDPREYDYIAAPKDDGYRSIHWVVKFHSKEPQYKNLPLRRIEIQIRSRLQHTWATAVETVDFFAHQNLKLGGGDPQWKRFFALASAFFALAEQCPGVPGTNADLHSELRQLWNDLRVLARLSAWVSALQTVESASVHANAAYLLIESDLEQRFVRTTGWPLAEVEEANAEYARAEQKVAEDPRNRSALLTTAESISELREAYPSYYGDTSGFLHRLRSVLNDWSQ